MKNFFRLIFGRGPKKPEGDLVAEAELYNAVGVAAHENVGRDEVSVLIYVELVEGGIDHCLRFAEADSPHFHGVHTDGNFAIALWNLYKFVMDQSLEKRWSKMEYFIENGEIDVSFSYEPVNEEIPFWERIPAVFEKYFPGKTSVEA